MARLLRHHRSAFQLHLDGGILWRALDGRVYDFGVLPAEADVFVGGHADLFILRDRGGLRRRERGLRCNLWAPDVLDLPRWKIRGYRATRFAVEWHQAYCREATAKRAATLDFVEAPLHDVAFRASWRHLLGTCHGAGHMGRRTGKTKVDQWNLYLGRFVLDALREHRRHLLALHRPAARRSGAPGVEAVLPGRQERVRMAELEVHSQEACSDSGW
mmetsp:Transcript_108243/g.345700  ORF Transcript_108243/g.345700 Transcript_108243/m.345700 type:complete len:216 (-) Transcript_108243:235-882(-)